MNWYNIVGLLVLVSIFCVIVGGTARAAGWREALIGWTFAIGMTLLIAASVFLMLKP